MGLIENLVKKVLEKGTIEEKIQLSESVYRLRIKSEYIKHVEFVPGHFLRLGVGIGQDETSLKDKVRSYSVWDLDRKDGILDLAIATHSGGVGARWVESCEAGDQVHFRWKKGNFLLDTSADSYLMIGDLSALSHFHVLKRNLPKGKQVQSLIYSPKVEELFADVDGTKPFDFYQMPENPIKEIKAKLKGLVSGMQGRKMVYLAGDSRVCVALNSYFRQEPNWETKQIKTKPFWNPGKKGLE
ncbi:hypothetical protein GCM10009119_30820 [Algoriphagus jejuensis]|uniref:FAD-binding FR-type domain-containing protein n=1 Tax=Algoriphagus jejuensis TaxID=419934 RepID=A0ABN1N2U2_9BACT